MSLFTEFTTDEHRRCWTWWNRRGEAGEMIVKQDEHGDCMFIVLHGKVA